MIDQFPPEIIDQLGYYVYLYVHPKTGKVFYVGKGKGNRVFAHLKDESESEKTKVIKEILREGLEPQIEILVHGLEDKTTALKIESAVIDLFEHNKLTNIIRGYESSTFGRIGVEQLVAQYRQEPVDIVHSVLLIRINQMFRHGMTPIELYDVTRGVWKVGVNREKVQFAFAVYHGIVREVYEILTWHSGGTTFSSRPDLNKEFTSSDRYEFIGRLAPKQIRNMYLYKSVSKYFTEHSQNPLKYVNVD